MYMWLWCSTLMLGHVVECLASGAVAPPASTARTSPGLRPGGEAARQTPLAGGVGKDRRQSQASGRDCVPGSRDILHLGPP